MSPGREFRSQCHFWVIMKSQPSFLNCLGLTFQIYKMGRVTPDPRPLVRVRSKDLQHLKHSREQRSKEGGTGQGPPPTSPDSWALALDPRHAGLAQAPPASDTDRWFPALFLVPGRKKAGRLETRTHGGKEKWGVWVWTPNPQGRARSLTSPALASLGFGKAVTVGWRPVPTLDPPEAVATPTVSSPRPNPPQPLPLLTPPLALPQHILCTQRSTFAAGRAEGFLAASASLIPI